MKVLFLRLYGNERSPNTGTWAPEMVSKVASSNHPSIHTLAISFFCVPKILLIGDARRLGINGLILSLILCFGCLVDYSGSWRARYYGVNFIPLHRGLLETVLTFGILFLHFFSPLPPPPCSTLYGVFLTRPARIRAVEAITSSGDKVSSLLR